jgi:glutamyl-Q tRNA(Asp) synthetase
MYRGRFAPSPTGPLHFGSLVAALSSYLEARRAGGEWLIRMEDVDGPRSRPEAAVAILSTLDALGFRADGEVVYQSQRSSLYKHALERLGSHIYPCSCSRKDVGATGEGRYPGTCREGAAPGKPVRAIRLRVNGEPVCFDDLIQGRFCSNLELDLGDFSLVRADAGIYSYQLAVVVDDEAQGVTDIVRGADLLDSTPRQIFLQRLLGYRELRYLHIPVATGPDGEKLSKQNLAPAISANEASSLLCAGLRFLGQDPPAELDRAEPHRVWEWASSNWERERIPACLKLPYL